MGTRSHTTLWSRVSFPMIILYPTHVCRIQRTLDATHGTALMRSGFVGRGDLSLLHTMAPFARLSSAPPNRTDRISFPPVLAPALRRFGRDNRPVRKAYRRRYH